MDIAFLNHQNSWALIHFNKYQDINNIVSTVQKQNYHNDFLYSMNQRFKAPLQQELLFKLQLFCKKQYEQLQAIHDQFLKQVSSAHISEDQFMKILKDLSISYEILLIQFCNECEDEDLPQLGRFLLTLFLQMNSCIRWIARNSVKIKPDLMKVVEKVFIENNVKNDEKNFYKVKENSLFMANGINQQIYRLSNFIVNDKVQIDKQIDEALSKKDAVKSLQESKCSHQIMQALNCLQNKNQTFNSFLDLNDDHLDEFKKSLKFEPFSRLKTLYEQDSAKKLTDAKKRIQEKLKNFVHTVMKDKNETTKKKIKGCQTELDKFLIDGLEQQIIFKEEEIKRLEIKLKYEKERSEKLESLVKSKALEAEETQTKYRTLNNFSILKQTNAFKKNNSEGTEPLTESVNLGGTAMEDSKKSVLQIDRKKLKLQPKTIQFFEQFTRPLQEKMDKKISTKIFPILSHIEGTVSYHFDGSNNSHKLITKQFRRPQSRQSLISIKNFQSFNPCKKKSEHLSKKKIFYNEPHIIKPKEPKVSFFAKDLRNRNSSQHSNASHVSHHFEKIEIEPSSLGIRKNAKKTLFQPIKKHYKYSIRIPQKRANIFQEDIESIFLKSERAFEYEFVNLNEVPGSKKDFESSHAYRSFFKIFIKFIQNLRIKSQQSYIHLKNFLRFPYSSIYHKGMKGVRKQKADKKLSYSEVEGIMQKLRALHEDCEEWPCHHFIKFLSKFGLYIE